MLLIWGDRSIGDVRGRITKTVCDGLGGRGRADEIVIAPHLDSSGVTKEDVPVVIDLPWDASGDTRRESAAAASGVLWMGAAPPTDLRARLGLQRRSDVPVWALVVSYQDHAPSKGRDGSDTDAVWVITPEIDRHRPTLRRVVRTVRAASIGGLRLEVGDSDRVTRSAAARATRAWMAHLTDAKDVEEYTIMGGDAMWVEFSDGTREKRSSPVASDDDLISEMKFLASHGEDQRGRDQRFDFNKPRMDVLVAGRWRAHGEAWSTSPPVLTLRSNRGGDISLNDLDVADSNLLGLLREMIAGTYRQNVVIGASMGAGKTTLVQALCAEVPEDERIDTFEDTPELQLKHYGLHDFTVERLVRDENQDGEGGLPMSAHIRAAKRAATKKLVIGETRGEGTLALLDAMTSGITGCLVTLHSPPGREVLAKLVSYAIFEGAPLDYARGQVDKAVDVVIFMARDDQKRRRIFNVSQLIGLDVSTGDFVTESLWQLGVGQTYAAAVGQPTRSLRNSYIAAGLRHLLDDDKGVSTNGRLAQSS